MTGQPPYGREPSVARGSRLTESARKLWSTGGQRRVEHAPRPEERTLPARATLAVGVRSRLRRARRNARKRLLELLFGVGRKLGDSLGSGHCAPRGKRRDPRP